MRHTGLVNEKPGDGASLKGTSSGLSIIHEAGKAGSFCGNDCHAGDMGIDAVVPIQETGHVDLVADGQTFNGLINIGVFSAKIRFNGESVSVLAV